MKRRIPNPVKSDSHKNGAEGDEFEAEDGEETKESKEIVDQYPPEAIALLAKIDKYLLLRQYLEPNAVKAGFLDLFLFSMLRRGDMKIRDLSLNPEQSQFGNILRL